VTESQTTKDRLIEAACRIFADKGYRDATVAEICEAAEANIAAVNYHFGDKESLYDTVWRHAFSITSATYPINGGLDENLSLEDKISCYASAILHRIFSDTEAGLFPRLLSREMASPTIALEKIASDALFPQADHLKQALVDYLGEDTDDQIIRSCMHSIVGQCAFYNFSRALRERVIGRPSMTDQEIETVARHIAVFSLGGLQAVKEGVNA
jgi:AcrR family transcriptional regulator